MIVLDASVLIGYLDGDDAHHHGAEALLAAAVDDEFGANPLTLAEVLVVPARDGRLEAVMGVLRDLEIAELAFPSDIASRLALLRVATGLKMPDCCVLLSAESPTRPSPLSTTGSSGPPRTEGGPSAQK